MELAIFVDGMGRFVYVERRNGKQVLGSTITIKEFNLSVGLPCGILWSISMMFSFLVMTDICITKINGLGNCVMRKYHEVYLDTKLSGRQLALDLLAKCYQRSPKPGPCRLTKLSVM